MIQICIQSHLQTKTAMIKACGASNVAYWAGHMVYSICMHYECVWCMKNTNTVLTTYECTLNYKMTSQQ